ncbi:MAG: helix-turn-helix domain-containing protein [Crenarchaeota archaeon]|nr:helix-turn-helix domain-containing protein [Thermoproteota archaeon]
MKSLIATLGFDDKPITHATLIDRYDLLIAIALKTSSEAWSRVEMAYHKALGVVRDRIQRARLVGVEIPAGVGRERLLSWLTRRVKEVVEPVVRDSSSVVLQLSGGPRMLILAVYTAAMSLDDPEASKITVIVEGEGFAAEAWEPLINLKPVPLTSLHRAVLKILLEAGAPLGPTDVASRLGVSKSTAYKYLRQLMEHGLVEKVNEKGKYRATGRALVNAAV